MPEGLHSLLHSNLFMFCSSPRLPTARVKTFRRAQPAPPNVVLLGIMLCLLSSCRMAFTVVTQGGEHQLRPAVLPAAPGPRVLIFALDGAGYNELMQAIRSGKAPHLQALLGPEQQAGRFAHGYEAPNAMSILPSTTMAAWSSIFTGQPPAQ